VRGYFLNNDVWGPHSITHLIIPTDREKREISKKAMAKKREKEKIKKLKEQGW